MNFRRGGHFIIDGQYGSTGKGLAASYVAEKYGDAFDLVVSNAGPNSGHTSYFGDQKIVLKQLPTYAVHRALAGRPVPVFLSGGAVINEVILADELNRYPKVPVNISAQAAKISDEDMASEGSGSVAAVAGTRQGVGAAIARKVLRDPTAVMGYNFMRHVPDYRGARVLFEVSQGFSLGINSHFYPKVTSRECTVMQACADARFPAQHVRSVFMVIRTFPIRVSNHDGHSSGEWYNDQDEVSWDAIGVEPELTTVTKRVRRVATFSMTQYADAIYANQPTHILVNFMNYIKDEQRRKEFAIRLHDTAQRILGYAPTFLFGFGPRVEDVRGQP